MITVIISEVDGWREWKHRARTKDAQTAIIRAMNKHFPRSEPPRESWRLNSLRKR